PSTASGYRRWISSGSCQQRAAALPIPRPLAAVAVARSMYVGKTGTARPTGAARQHQVLLRAWARCVVASERRSKCYSEVRGIGGAADCDLSQERQEHIESSRGLREQLL